MIKRLRRDGALGQGLALAAAVALLAIAGCTQGGPSPHLSGTSGGAGVSGMPTGGGQVGRSAVRWRSCATSLNPRLRCARLTVPLDYGHPGGRKITLALAEVPATAPAARRQGILLVNPGGPGGSMTLSDGHNLATVTAQGLPKAVTSEYDIIGFDTRGVGASVPALTCDPGFFASEPTSYVPANAAAEQALVSRAKTYAKDCQRQFGWLLPFMTTANMVRDMDQIRAALGQRQLSYFGTSFGTYLGQVYATLFPHRIHRMVLDSTVNPAGAWYADNIAQDYAFQSRADAFLAWIARYDGVYHLGATASQVKAAWNAARARLAAHPIANNTGPSIGPAEFEDAMQAAGYSNGYWPYLAHALAAYVRGGATSELLYWFRANQTPPNEFAVYNAVECADVAWPRSWAKWDADTRKVYAKAPFLAWQNTWFNAACAFWPTHGPAQPMRIGAPGLPPILMLQGTLDAATPYPGAQIAHRLLPTARMVVVAGGGNHGQFLNNASPCVIGYVSRYLQAGAVPSRPGLVNATCPALPDPAP